MKKRMAITTLGILMLASVIAVTVYSGDSYTFESEEFAYWTTTGNLSNMEGMNVSWEDGNTTLSFNLLFKPDNFTIILFNQEKEIITEHHYSGGGGGGSSTKYVDKIVLEPKFYDRNITEIVDNEIVIKEIEYINDGYKTWMLVLAMIFGVIFCWVIMRKGKDPYNAEVEIGGEKDV